MEELMKFKEEFIYKGDSYLILHCEKDSIVSPDKMDYISAMIGNMQEDKLIYESDDYKLKLLGIQKSSEDELNELSISVNYTGGLILVKDFVQDYRSTEDYPCYCYKKVIELIFEEGRLVTSIDHSKDMVRIRKNIEKGLRDIRNKRDFRCIQRFIKESFVQNYRNPMQKKRWNLLFDRLRHN
jgi:hypothetical protein